MSPKMVFKAILLAMLVATCAIGYCQSNEDEKAKEAKEKEQKAYEKHKELKSEIKKNQTPEDILVIMGEPEEVETFQKGKDMVEVWYYDGRDVRIEFRNDKTSSWFVRFFPDKPPKEQKKPKPPKESEEKCNLCDESPKTK
jgi:hypothetical protein